MKGRKIFTHDEAETIRQLLRRKIQSERNEQKKIRSKLRNDLRFHITDFDGTYSGFGSDDFDRLIELGTIQINSSSSIASERDQRSPARDRMVRRDEDYVINLCDEILGRSARRWHRFNFLRGDAGTTLPVDAYYPDLKLVVEYRERQHTQSVPHFDKPHRLTVSGVPRREQRRLYDQRRRDVLPQWGIGLVEIDFSDLVHRRNGRLVRDRTADRAVIEGRLQPYLS